MPDEVVTLANGEGVVNPIVAEHPGLVDVPGRQHGDLGDRHVHALGAKERSVRRVMADDEEARDRQDEHDLERDRQQGIRDEDESGEGSYVNGQVAQEVAESLPGGILVEFGRYGVDHRLE